MTVTLAEVRAAVSAFAHPEEPDIVFAGVSTDTRTLNQGELFVALISPANDGHGFITRAIELGASGVVVSQDVAVPDGMPVIRVPYTELAYGQIARAWRDKFTVPVVGVTGSVGKTSVKEMLAAALSPLGPILKTAASQNNETGVPKTLLQLSEIHKAVVVEMGMRGAGQIAALCAIARPTAGVITVIGENHLELLGSKDAIADAKGELLEALPADGLAVLNQDDPYFERLRAKTQARVVTYGLVSQAADVCAADITRTEDGWLFTVKGAPVRLSALSRHDIGNALAALAVAEALGVPIRKAAQSVGDYVPPPMRMESVKTPWGGTILNDAYNAAPASVRSALATLTSQTGGRKFAFLGDMKELGTFAEQAHQELGSAIDELGGLDALYTVGALAGLIPGAAGRFSTSLDAVQAAAGMDWQAGDIILVKGSRAMAMEHIVAALVERSPREH